MSRLNFRLEATATGSRARAARFTTLHNEVLTPTFMPVGTHAAVRAQRREDVIESGAQVLLANTYHLMLRPGTALFEKLGGIHRFMNWPRSVLTDSGGFQIYSLPGSRSVTEEGAEFKSYVDQTLVRLSPESSIAAQRAIGSDIMMVLDQCVPSTVERGSAEKAMELTHRWARRSLAARGDSAQALFGIVQGASYTDLRMVSARALTEMPFDGFAIGGLAVGEGTGEREECTATVTELLPADLPRYLMGVGTTRDLLEAVHRGVDMFDCILPTALAKQGVAFTSLGRRDLRRALYRGMEGPIDPACRCHTCATHSIAYLFHLNKVQESVGWQLLGLHNVHFYMQLMRTMREHILADTWSAFYREQREVLDARDSYGRPATHITKAQRQLAKTKLGRYEVVVRDGIGRIRDVTSGEVMHSVNDPAEEAHALYVEQSRLVERLVPGGGVRGDDPSGVAAPDADAPGEAAPGEAPPLVVWDVGLGAGANAMAAILAVEASQGAADGPPAVRRPPDGRPAVRRPPDGRPTVRRPPDGRPAVRRPLLLVSFEQDLDSLKLALRHPAWFKHLRHPAPRGLLADGRWRSARARVDWRLLHGDFAARKFEAPPPDLIFFDPFSFKTDGRLWTLDAFRELYRVCGLRAVELYTYTYSTSVRAAMLAAGFHVAKGRGTGPKAETTIALSPLAAARGAGWRFLAEEWLTRWRRSDGQSPPGAVAGEESWRRAIEEHAQFRGADKHGR